MTSRTTFGELIAVADRSLESAARRAAAGGPLHADTVAAEAAEFLAVVNPMLKTMSRYAADVTAVLAPVPDQAPAAHSPWTSAAAEVRSAIVDAHRDRQKDSPAGRAWPHQRLTSSVIRDIDTAVTAISAARDLLHTHFHTSQDGTRHYRSEWASVIASPAAQKAVLIEVAGWSRHLVALGHRITSVPRSRTPSYKQRHSVAGICQGLTALIAAVDTAQNLDPVTTADIRQLHAIPASMTGRPREPDRDESIATLHRGIAECAEHVRVSTTTSLPDATWSPAVSTESFRQTATCAVVISHHAEILQRSLGARARQLGATQVSDDLIASAGTAGKARRAWLTAARAWQHFTIDTTTGITPAAQETADLAWWTGRLAYADPDWTLASGPRHDRRPPDLLAPNPETFTGTLTALHQVCATLTSLAAADYTRIRTAARAGRILAPAAQAPSSAPAQYERAPVSDCGYLLATYREAGVASVKATAKVSELSAQQDVYLNELTCLMVPENQPAQATILSTSATAIVAHDPQAPPGPIERTLLDLGVTSPELLNRGITLDKAASQLLADAADHTATLRWHTAVTRPDAITSPAQITRHVLTPDRPEPAQALLRTLRPIVGRAAERQPEQLQAEP